MTIHALDKNFLIASMPVQYRDRPAGSVSKLNTYSDGIKVLMTIFRLYKDYKPLHFFTMVAVILALISLIFFIPVFGEYIFTGLVPKLPTLIMAGFTMMGALMSLGVGLVLDTEVKNSKKNFEIQMNLISLLWRKHD